MNDSVDNSLKHNQAMDFLSRRYNAWEIHVPKREYLKEECRGGYNFAKTLDLVMEVKDDPNVYREVMKTLYSIASHPKAGSLSWEMRRFIRRAPTGLIPEFVRLIRETAKIDPKYIIDMDSFVFDAGHEPQESEIMASRVLDGLKSRLGTAESRVRERKEEERERFLQDSIEI